MRLLMFLVVATLSTLAITTTESFGQESEQDTSGKGAVLCTWLLLIDTRIEMDICVPGKSPTFREDLSWAIDATNDFIVVNSPTPITKVMLEEFISRRLNDARAKTAAGEITIVDCRPRGSVGPLEAQSREDFRRGITSFLSVPRKPLMNPCL